MTDVERFRMATGYECNLEDPKTHCEWVMWYKRNCRDPLLTRTADKIAVRDYVRELGYDRIMTEAQCCHDPSDGDMTPPCVVKMNNASGRNIFVYSEDQEKEARKQIRAWMGKPYGVEKEEWCYQDIKPGFTIEPMLWREGQPHILYRFLSWYGRVKCIEAHEYALNGGHPMTLSHTVFWRDWEKIGVTIDGRATKVTAKPDALAEMIHIAEELSRPLRFSRVDLYEHNGVKFSEITHYPRSGKYRYEPRTFDTFMGRFWK